MFLAEMNSAGEKQMKLSSPQLDKELKMKKMCCDQKQILHVETSSVSPFPSIPVQIHGRRRIPVGPPSHIGHFSRGTASTAQFGLLNQQK